MSFLSNSLVSTLQNVKQRFLFPLAAAENYVSTRGKKVKARTSTRNQDGPNHSRPKHRGLKKRPGMHVTSGTLLVTQLTTRFHPGLYVGFGKNGTLWAMEPGKVCITCEKTNLNWDHTWIQRCYGGREGQTIYKKHLNIIPDPQHTRFKLVDAI